MMRIHVEPTIVQRSLMEAGIMPLDFAGEIHFMLSTVMRSIIVAFGSETDAVHIQIPEYMMHRDLNEFARVIEISLMQAKVLVHHRCMRMRATSLSWYRREHA